MLLYEPRVHKPQWGQASPYKRATECADWVAHKWERACGDQYGGSTLAVLHCAMESTNGSLSAAVKKPIGSPA